MNDDNVLELAQVINQKSNDPIGGLRLRRGITTAVNTPAATATVTIGGVSIPNVTCSRSAIPVVGDSVDVLIDGPAPRITSIVGAALNWIYVGSGGGAPAFQNTWTNLDAAHTTCSFAKDAMGFVHLRGAIKGGTQSWVFYLPAGYRPSGVEEFLCLVPGGTTGNGFLPCDIRIWPSDGGLEVLGGPSAPAWCYLQSWSWYGSQ
jgi:hypothetical protein